MFKSILKLASVVIDNIFQLEIMQCKSSSNFNSFILSSKSGKTKRRGSHLPICLMCVLKIGNLKEIAISDLKSASW